MTWHRVTPTRGAAAVPALITILHRRFGDDTPIVSHGGHVYILDTLLSELRTLLGGAATVKRVTSPPWAGIERGGR